MKGRRLIHYAIFMSLALLGSCAKEGPTGPTGNAGPSLSGSISGHVKLYDKYGSQVLTGLSNVKLYFNGSVNNISPDTNGYYLFSSLVTGNYSIAATDSAYAATSKNNIQLVAGSLNQDIRLSALPDSFIQTMHAFHNSGATFDSVVISLTPDVRTRNCLLFAHSSASVGSTPGRYLVVQVVTIPPLVSTVLATVPAQDLYDAGLTSGARVYYGAYSYVVGDVSVYEDLSTGRNVYNAVNANPVVDSTYVP